MSIFSKLQIQDIELHHEVARPDLEIRKMYKILFIDDDGLSVLDRLRETYKYDVTLVRDIVNLYDVEPYDIVMCDLHGVGIASSEKKQGIGLLSNISKAYPNKYTILYTSAELSNEQICTEIVGFDGFIVKGRSADEWDAIIDKAITELRNPIARWRKVKNVLEANNVRSTDIVSVENLFVKCYNRNRDFKISKALKFVRDTKKAEELLKILKPIFDTAISVVV